MSVTVYEAFSNVFNLIVVHAHNEMQVSFNPLKVFVGTEISPISLIRTDLSHVANAVIGEYRVPTPAAVTVVITALSGGPSPFSSHHPRLLSFFFLLFVLMDIFLVLFMKC